jgi:hypothetical protein
MSNRKKHLGIHLGYLTTTCECCATECDATEISHYYRGEGKDVAKLDLCEECFEDFISENVMDDNERVQYQTDVLSETHFDDLNDWARKEAILLFLGKDDLPRTIEQISEFFDALSNWIGWHPDSSFKDYVNKKTDKPLFTPEEAIALDQVLSECFDICHGANVDIYQLALEAMQRAGVMPKEETEPETKTDDITHGEPAEIVPVVELLVEAGRLMADEEGEEYTQWRQAVNTALKRPDTLPQYWFIMLPEVNKVIVFEFKTDYDRAYAWYKEENFDGRLTARLRAFGIKHYERDCSVCFESK